MQLVRWSFGGMECGTGTWGLETGTWDMELGDVAMWGFGDLGTQGHET